MSRLALLLLALAACAAPDPADDVEPLFSALENGSSEEALEATEKLARLYDDSMQPRLRRLMEASSQSLVRSLLLLSELETEGSAQILLEGVPRLLKSKKPEVSRLAVVAAGLRKLGRATREILDYYDRTEEAAALKALGRIWERPLGAPSLRDDEENDRLSALIPIHRLAMSGASTVAICEAMFRIMTRAELDDFLAAHAADRFHARGHCDQAVRKKGFDPNRGARIHEAFLTNDDAELVAEILATSPHPLREEAVRAKLDDRREVAEGFRVCDVAARRLRTLKK